MSNTLFYANLLKQSIIHYSKLFEKRSVRNKSIQFLVGYFLPHFDKQTRKNQLRKSLFVLSSYQSLPRTVHSNRQALANGGAFSTNQKSTLKISKSLRIVCIILLFKPKCVCVCVLRFSGGTTPVLSQLICSWSRTPPKSIRNIQVEARFLSNYFVRQILAPFWIFSLKEFYTFNALG